jgi:RimJ/RimL family protein N-acetyltransferase
MPTPAALRVSTARLLLRPVEDGDAAATAALVTPDVAANLSTWPSPMSEAQALERIALARKMLAERAAVDAAIVRRSDSRLLGWIGLLREAPRSARLGYWIGRPFRNQGYMKEASAAFIPMAASYLAIDSIEALALVGNAASTAVLESLDFATAGERLAFMETCGQQELCLVYRLDLSAAL